MATAVPSRFAVLSIDDDDFKPKKTSKPTNTGKTNSKSNKNDKQKPKKDDKKKPNKNKKKKNGGDSQQWEQWKEKDSMAVEETYEQELHQAILLSKIAYEAQEQNGTSKDQDGSKKSQSNKKSKKATMSLDEFNSMGTTNASTDTNIVSAPDNSDCKPRESDAEFFERVEKETKNEITKSKEKDMLKTRLNQLDDDITSAQLRVEVEKRDEQIAQLRDDVEALKEELTEVKKRNRKLYQILSHGEMKDKASVLAEVTKLQEIREELTLEVTSLHAQLEQERSKTRATTTDVKTTKQNNKKRPASENA